MAVVFKPQITVEIGCLNEMSIWTICLMFCFGGEIETIEYDEDHDSWKCKLIGKDIDGNELVFLTALYEPCHTVRCVTVF